LLKGRRTNPVPEFEFSSELCRRRSRRSCVEMMTSYATSEAALPNNPAPRIANRYFKTTMVFSFLQFPDLAATLIPF
jgi:hypothetical protein